MKHSGLHWPLITEADLAKQLGRYVANVRFGNDLSPVQRQRAVKEYLEAHPEETLLAHVTAELNNWLAGITPKETDNYVMLASINFVNCARRLVGRPRRKTSDQLFKHGPCSEQTHTATVDGASSALPGKPGGLIFGRAATSLPRCDVGAMRRAYDTKCLNGKRGARILYRVLCAISVACHQM